VLIELWVARDTPLHHTFGAYRPMQQGTCNFKAQYKNKQPYMSHGSVVYSSPQRGEQEHNKNMKGFYTRQTFEYPDCKYNPKNKYAVDARYE